jgi:hypothetical protein
LAKCQLVCTFDSSREPTMHSLAASGSISTLAGQQYRRHLFTHYPAFRSIAGWAYCVVIYYIPPYCVADPNNVQSTTTYRVPVRAGCDCNVARTEYTMVAGTEYGVRSTGMESSVTNIRTAEALGPPTNQFQILTQFYYYFTASYYWQRSFSYS